MNLLVIRHGQSEADILDVIEGRADFELTDLGKKQAMAMAEWVSNNYKIDKILASPLKRAMQTATFLSQKTGVDIEYDEDLMEYQNGLIKGLTREEADKKYPRPDIRFPHMRIYEMESDLDFRFRAEEVLSKIINENDDDKTIAIIAHGGIINMLYRSFLQLPNITNISVATGDTGVHRWFIDAEKRVVAFANSTKHLDNIQ